MTEVIVGPNGQRVVVLAAEPDQKCDLCDKMDETRPYGPDGKNVCFDCGQLDKEGTTKRMNHVLFGDPL